jgi:hypothetical protein
MTVDKQGSFWGPPNLFVAEEEPTMEITHWQKHKGTTLLGGLPATWNEMWLSKSILLEGMEPVRSFTLAAGTRSALTAAEQLFSWKSSQSIDHSLVLANSYA